MSFGGGREVAQRAVSRRVLIGSGAAGVGALLVPRVGSAEALKGTPADSRSARSKTAYRLSTRGRAVCNACKAHAANRFYATWDAAEGDRAHTGCNCRIVTQSLRNGRWVQYFASGDVYDLRWGVRPRKR